jgi:hypothetical protein
LQTTDRGTKELKQNDRYYIEGTITLCFFVPQSPNLKREFELEFDWRNFNTGGGEVRQNIAEEVAT